MKCIRLESLRVAHAPLILACCFHVAACAADSGQSAGAEPATDPESGEVDPAQDEPTTDPSYGGDSPADDGLYASDPDAVLAALPEAMQPAVLLDALKQRLIAPDLEHGALALFTDVVTIEAGEDVTYCTYLDAISDEVTYIHDTLGSQTPHGHHAILQYLTTPREPGTRPCPSDSDLDAQLGQILGGTGGEGTSAIVLPGNVVSEVPAGAQLVINHHWINTGDAAVEAQAQIVTVPPESLQDMVIARALSMVVVDFEIAAGVAGEASGECTFDKRTQVLSMLGHEHQWGTHVKAERMGANQTVIFDHDYDPDMISLPLTTYYPLDEPFVFEPGDAVRLTCQWENTSDDALVFPREMCVFFGWQIGSDQDDICYGGNWL